jgi:hypothetical protein
MSTFDKVFAELSRAVPLDKHDLDNQLIEHAELFRQVCDHLALYTAERDTTEARIGQQVRESAVGAKEKITETEIKRLVKLDERVAILDLNVDRLKGLKEAYIERRHAFAKLVDLHGNQYWSEHSGIARGSKMVHEGRRERVRDVIRSNRER